MQSPHARSVPELLSDAFDQLGKLIQNEVRLARTELSQKLTQAGMGAALLGGSAVLLIPTLVLLLISIAIWLTQLGMSPVSAHFIATAIGAGASIILAMVGMNYLKPSNLRPDVTIQQVGRDVEAAKEIAR